MRDVPVEQDAARAVVCHRHAAWAERRDARVNFCGRAAGVVVRQWRCRRCRVVELFAAGHAWCVARVGDALQRHVEHAGREWTAGVVSAPLDLDDGDVARHVVPDAAERAGCGDRVRLCSGVRGCRCGVRCGRAACGLVHASATAARFKVDLDLVRRGCHATRSSSSRRDGAARARACRQTRAPKTRCH